MAGTLYKKQDIPSSFQRKMSFIGGLLREYRWEEGLTRKEVQDLSGIHFRTIYRIEHGQNISLVTLFRYMNFFGLEMSDLAFTDEEIE